MVLYLIHVGTGLPRHKPGIRAGPIRVALLLWSRDLNEGVLSVAVAV